MPSPQTDAGAQAPQPPPPHAPTPGLWDRLRRAGGALLVDTFFRGASGSFRLLPIAHPRLHGVEVVRDVAYLDDGVPEHRLDIYRPRNRTGPLPVVFYVHGGGFRILSKESHWVFALFFARRGYLVVTIDYRLAPRHPYPAAHADAAAALCWAHRHVADYGGDPERIALAGESAGANIVTALALATSYRRAEPWTEELFACGLMPKAVLPACGILQVSRPHRFLEQRRMSPFFFDRIFEVGDAYLRGITIGAPGAHDMADPLLILEGPDAPERPLPPFFAPVGTADPLLDDTRRLESALRRRNVECEARYYDGEHHAFHGFVFLPNARRCWRDTYAFLDRHLPVR